MQPDYAAAMLRSSSFVGAMVLLVACGTPEPVLSGVPETNILDEPDDEGTLPVERAAVYSRPADVYVDVRHLGGRSFPGSRDVVADQLGALLESEELGGDNGQELRFERATLRVVDDLIYMVEVPLPEPLRRSDALEYLGFPSQVGRYIVLHREYRLNHEWSFRRIRMMRDSPDNELVNSVEAWRWVPGERSQRR